MKRSKLIQQDGIEHTRRNPSGRKGGKRDEAYHNPISQEEIDICLNCKEKTCKPNGCKHLENVCKNCKHLTFSDCYGECGLGVRGIVRPFDSCKCFERRVRK